MYVTMSIAFRLLIAVSNIIDLSNARPLCLRHAASTFRVEFSGCGNLLVHAHDLGYVRICKPVGTAKHGERDFASGGLSFKPALSNAQDGSGFVQCADDKHRNALSGVGRSLRNLAHGLFLLHPLGQPTGAVGHAAFSAWHLVLAGAGGEYVFLSPGGSHYRRSTYGERYFRPAADGWYPERSHRSARPVLIDADALYPGMPIPAWPAAVPGETFIPPPEVIAARLNLDPRTDVSVVRRHVRYIDGKPAIISDDYFDEKIVRGTELAEPEDTTREDILKEAGYEQVYDIDEIITRMPTPDEITRLGISVGTPVAEHIRTGYTADGKPVRVMISIVPGDTLILQYTIPT
jgi:UTRA domain